MDNRPLALQDRQVQMTTGGKIALASTADAFTLASMMEVSEMLPNKMKKEQAAIAIIAGAGLGLQPFASVQNIAVIRNRPCIWGDALVALCKPMIEDESITWHRDAKGQRVGCTYSIKRKGVKTPYIGEFSLGMATKAGLMSNPTWKNYTHRMLKNRARAFALRDGFADLIMGFGIREEQEDQSYIETPNDIVSVEQGNATHKNDAEELVNELNAPQNKLEQPQPFVYESVDDAEDVPVETVENTESPQQD